MSSPPNSHQDSNTPSADPPASEQNNSTSITFEFSIPASRPPPNPTTTPAFTSSEPPAGSETPGPGAEATTQSNTIPPSGSNSPEGLHPGGAGGQGPSFFWTFTIRPDGNNGTPSVGLAPPRPPSGASDQPNDPAAPARPDRPTNIPWILPPFFNFFMPIRQEAQPDPEKAAELLRSLPTVGARLLMRVDNIVTAEETDCPPDEKGWKCGICLEGVDREESKEEKKPQDTGVKVLPCNHLFHGQCLEPWFATKHTCPSCRLDLDPLHTLDTPPQRDSSRPAASGPSRHRGTHPYARPPNHRTAEPAPQDPGQEPHRQLHPGPGAENNTNDRGDMPSITFIWSAPPGGDLPPGFNPFGFPLQPPQPRQESVSPMTTVPGAQPDQAQPEAGPNEGQDRNVGPAPPSTPQQLFDFPTFASPLAMGTRSSPAPEGAQEGTAGPPSTVSARSADATNEPLMEPANELSSASTRAQQSTVGTSFPTAAPADASSMANVEGSLAGTTDDTLEGRSAPSSAPSDDRPQPQRRPHIHFVHQGLGNPLGLGGLSFPFPPPHVMPAGPGQPAEAQTGEAAAEAGRPAPFVPQSLESWTEEREKLLGWRCDAPECIFAPPTGEDDDVYMPDVGTDDEEGKEMLSLYSLLQSPLEADQVHEAKTSLEGSDTRAGVNESSYTAKDRFVLLACPHRYHRTCIELAERSSGRFMKREQDRVWVRCDRCRKDGWVVGRGDVDAPSEKEVERMVAV